jgi:hypothetical protein
MAIKISGCTVIDDSRNITNVCCATATRFLGDGSCLTGVGVPTGTIITTGLLSDTEPPTGFLNTRQVYNQCSFPQLYNAVGLQTTGVSTLVCNDSVSNCICDFYCCYCCCNTIAYCGLAATEFNNLCSVACMPFISSTGKSTLGRPGENMIAYFSCTGRTVCYVPSFQLCSACANWCGGTCDGQLFVCPHFSVNCTSAFGPFTSLCCLPMLVGRQICTCSSESPNGCFYAFDFTFDCANQIPNAGLLQRVITTGICFVSDSKCRGLIVYGQGVCRDQACAFCCQCYFSPNVFNYVFTDNGGCTFTACTSISCLASICAVATTTAFHASIGNIPRCVAAGPQAFYSEKCDNFIILPRLQTACWSCDSSNRCTDVWFCYLLQSSNLTTWTGAPIAKTLCCVGFATSYCASIVGCCQTCTSGYNLEFHRGNCSENSRLTDRTGALLIAEQHNSPGAAVLCYDSVTDCHYYYYPGGLLNQYYSIDLSTSCMIAYRTCFSVYNIFNGKAILSSFGHQGPGSSACYNSIFRTLDLKTFSLGNLVSNSFATNATGCVVFPGNYGEGSACRITRATRVFSNGLCNQPLPDYLFSLKKVGSSYVGINGGTTNDGLNFTIPSSPCFLLRQCFNDPYVINTRFTNPVLGTTISREMCCEGFGAYSAGRRSAERVTSLYNYNTSTQFLTPDFTPVAQNDFSTKTFIKS